MRSARREILCRGEQGEAGRGHFFQCSVVDAKPVDDRREFFERGGVAHVLPQQFVELQVALNGVVDQEPERRIGRETLDKHRPRRIGRGMAVVIWLGERRPRSAD